MSRNDVILGIVAAVLVAFSLIVAIVLPRRSPNFPGQHVGRIVAIGAVLIIAMLAAVEVLGETHHFASAEGEGGGTPTEQAPTTSGPTTTAPAPTPTETSGGGQEGDPAAGKEVFMTAAQPPCSGCHTLAEANATGQVGPNLDEALKGKTPEFIHESIVDPDAEITSGFQGGIMPGTYGDQLSEKQLNDLVAFLVQATSG